MIDVKLILDQADAVKEKLKFRLKDPSSLDRICELYNEKRAAQAKADQLRNQKKLISREIGAAKAKGGDASEPMKKVDELSRELETLETTEKEIGAKVEALLLLVPNIPQDGVPAGADESSNQEIKRWGEPRRFDFKPLPHFEISEKLGILDFERGAKISGSGFTLYHGLGSRLERALFNFMLDTHGASGYEEKFVPFMVSGESLRGTGQLPKFQEDLYKLEGENLYMNPTAEVPLTNMYRDEILAESELPIRVTAYAPSFRKEAGSYGKDTRGIIRQHQFNKVELVKFTRPEDSETEHQTMLEEAEKILKLLNLPYRVLILSQGDMGFSASKCYDVEVWLPSLGNYKEISSVSNCLDFQARRANIKFRRESTGKPEFVHTLNGSGLAVGRTVVAVLENYQQPDGSVIVPEALVPYMGGLKRIEKNK
jgi:seryl-tRNA synthetase